MSGSRPERSLKAQNLPWLVSLIVFDILVVIAFIFPSLLSSASISEVTIGRALNALVLPVVVLLLTGLLPHNVKATLVYWKLADALPAHEAFTKHGPADPRVDMSALAAHLGELPETPAEQNRLWFKLYKEKDTAPTVVEAHRLYLLYRDMAAISLLLLLASPASLFLSGFGGSAIATIVGMFAVEYLIASISARNSGIRLVTNVLSLHSSTSTPASKPRTRKRASSP